MSGIVYTILWFGMVSHVPNMAAPSLAIPELRSSSSRFTTGSMSAGNPSYSVASSNNNNDGIDKPAPIHAPRATPLRTTRDAALSHGEESRNIATDTTTTTTTAQRYPRMVRSVVNNITLQHTVSAIDHTTSPYKADGESGYNPVPLMTNKEKLAEWDQGKCVVEEWQTRVYPTCNGFHEVGLEGGAEGGTKVKVLAWGGSRTTYQVEADGVPVALKGPHYEHESLYWYDKQKKDGIILERASASPYIPDIYGFCGLNVIMEFSVGGNIHDYLRGSRYNGGTANATLPNLDKLKVGHQIAGGVAAMHELAGPGKPPAFAHNDVCCHQYLFFDGVYKLNDFDHSKVLRTNKDTGEVCKNPLWMKIFKMRAPEEMRTSRHWKNAPSELATDKVDVYLMGNVMYYILTNKYLYEGKSRPAAVEQIMAGHRSSFFGAETSPDPAIRALATAIKMCWEDDPDQRPGSREVTDYLEAELAELDEEFNRTRVNRITLPERKEMLKERDWDRHN